MGFSRQEYWSGLPFPSPGDLPNPGIEPRSPALEADALTSEPPGKPLLTHYSTVILIKEAMRLSWGWCPSGLCSKPKAKPAHASGLWNWHLTPTNHKQLAGLQPISNFLILFLLFLYESLSSAPASKYCPIWVDFWLNKLLKNFLMLQFIFEHYPLYKKQP